MRRTAEGAHGDVLSGDRTKSKIDNLELIIESQDHILRFDVSMGHIYHLTIIKCREHLSKQRKHFFLLQSTIARDELVQLGSFAEFHYHIARINHHTLAVSDDA